MYGEKVVQYAHIVVEALCDAPAPRRAGALAFLVKAELHSDLFREDDSTVYAAQRDTRIGHLQSIDKRPPSSAACLPVHQAEAENPVLPQAYQYVEILRKPRAQLCHARSTAGLKSPGRLPHAPVLISSRLASPSNPLTNGLPSLTSQEAAALQAAVGLLIRGEDHGVDVALPAVERGHGRHVAHVAPALLPHPHLFCFA